MSIWSRLFGGAGTPPPAAPAPPSQPAALAALFRTPRVGRDPRWIERFYAAVPDAPLAAVEPAFHRGPDGFPYRNLDLPPGRGGQATTLRASLDAILDAGQGAVILGGDTTTPEWVFTFGDLLAFDLFGNFNGDPQDGPSHGQNRQIQVAAGARMLTGSPSESYFPARARRALGAYLMGRVAEGSGWRPGIAFVDMEGLQPRRNLMVNISLEELRGDQAAFDTEMRFIRWFLPRDHGLMPRAGMIEDSAFLPIGRD
ncbi:MAG TPA: hypothetical protein VGM87_14165 [Roseomonas sp.]